MISKLKRRRIIFRDKMNAAFHEAGHAIVMVHFGGRCGVSLSPRPGIHLREEKAWAGKCYYLPEIPEKSVKLAVSVAGALSESVYSCENEDKEFLDDFEGLLVVHEYWHELMSSTDLAPFLSDSSLYPDEVELNEIARTTYPILMKNWPAVEALARKLGFRKSLTDWQVDEVYRRWSPSPAAAQASRARRNRVHSCFN